MGQGRSLIIVYWSRPGLNAEVLITQPKRVHESSKSNVFRVPLIVEVFLNHGTECALNYIVGAPRNVSFWFHLTESSTGCVRH